MSSDFHFTLLAALQSAKEALNSAFISAFLSSLAGAGFGVWGAQRLAERATRRNELRDALIEANALIVLAATISNQALSTKKQHIAPLCKAYFEEREEAESINSILLAGGRPTNLPLFSANMIHITPLTVPIEAVKSLTYGAKLMPGRALALVAMVEQSLNELGHATSIRTAQVEILKNPNLPLNHFVQNYFGLKRKDGNTDALYHDSMVAISQYTDDVAFFAAELAEELQAHAVDVRKKLLTLAKDVGKANTIDFSEARESGLMPPRQTYESWLSGFRKQD